MGSPKFHAPAKLFYGALFTDAATLSAARDELAALHGPIDYESEVFDFDFTGYYQKEMAGPIKRIFYTFERPFDPVELVSVKIASNDIEKKYSRADGSRTINLDPGYATVAKIVLASTKDNIHRIYIRDGIYEEITLFYKDGSFRPFQWTFPDYRERYVPFFNRVRREMKLKASDKERN